MSAYTDGRSVPIYSLGNRPESPLDVGPAFETGELGGISQKLESFVAVMRNLEQGLMQERQKNRKLREEWARAQEQYDRVTRESESRVRELSFQENRLKSQIAEQSETQGDLKTKLNTIELELKKSQDELRQYKSAWADVLQREREAKMILIDGDQIKRTLADVETRSHDLAEELANEKKMRVQMERHAKSYELELQSALVRLHSSEGKFNELANELKALQQSRKNTDQEIERVEASMRERFRWEAAKEIESAKAVFEKESALDRERYRDRIREEIKSHFEAQVEVERERVGKVREQYEGERVAMKAMLEQHRLETGERLVLASRECADLRLELKQSAGELAAERAHAEKIQSIYDERVAKIEAQVREIQDAADSEIARYKDKLEELKTAADADRRTGIVRQSEVENELAAAKRRVSRFARNTRRRLSMKRRKLSSLRAEYHSETAKWRGLEAFVVAEKMRFDQTLVNAEAELRKLKATHPLHSTLRELRREIELIDDPTDLERAMQAYEDAKEQLKQSELDLDYQIDQLREARESGTLLATPAK